MECENKKEIIVLSDVFHLYLTRNVNNLRIFVIFMNTFDRTS